MNCDSRTLRLTCNLVHGRFDYNRVEVEDNIKNSIIESILLNFAMKRIYIHDHKCNEEHVLYGTEIIQTIDDFLNNKFKFVPSVLSLESAYFNELPRAIQRRFLGKEIDFFLLETWKSTTDLELNQMLNLIKNINIGT